MTIRSFHQLGETIEEDIKFRKFDDNEKFVTDQLMSIIKKNPFYNKIDTDIFDKTTWENITILTNHVSIENLCSSLRDGDYKAMINTYASIGEALKEKDLPFYLNAKKEQLETELHCVKYAALITKEGFYIKRGKKLGEGEEKKWATGLDLIGLKFVAMGSIINNEAFPNNVDRIKSEARLLEKIHEDGMRPEIVEPFMHVINAKRKNGEPKVIVIQDLYDGTLDDVSKDPAQIFSVMSQIAKGMEILHKKNLVFTDVCFTNFLIKKEGNKVIAKINDLGICGKATPGGMHHDLRALFELALALIIQDENLICFEYSNPDTKKSNLKHINDSIKALPPVALGCFKMVSKNFVQFKGLDPKKISAESSESVARFFETMKNKF